jgi:hypothetical protein
MRKLCMIFVAITMFAGVALAGGPQYLGGKFQTFGATRLVVAGIPPDDHALDLTSNCGPETYNPTCYNDATFTYSGVQFVPNKPLALSSVTVLSADYNVGGGDCGGGSPRFTIYLSGGPNLWGYFGPYPSFTGCYLGWLNTGNLTTDTAIRWFVGNASYTWATLEATYGSSLVTEIDIQVDGGWFTAQGQDVTIDNFTINNRVMRSVQAPHH